MRRLLIAASLAIIPVGFSAEPPANPIRPVDCATLTQIPAGIHANCGFLRVPENRRNRKSRTIETPFLRLHSSAPKPAADPLIIVTGGPGDRAIHGEYLGEMPAAADRDVIWFEQRGTALARPALHCQPYADALRRAARGLIDPAQLTREETAAARTCATDARARDVDLAGYTSLEIAADVDDLRRALGFEKISLYGVSYGGRVVAEVARDFPNAVRALVLNTPLPPEANYDEMSSAAMRRTLDMVFDGCAVDLACAARFPHLRRQLADVIAKARRQPLRLTVPDASAPGGHVEVIVNDAVIAGALTGQLYAPFTFEKLPKTIDALAQEDEATLAALVGSGGSDNAWLMRLAVWCNEEYVFENRAKIQAQRSEYPEFAGVDMGNVPVGVCEAAGLGRVAAPTTENAGAFDPATPPAWQRAMASHMAHVRLVVFPAGGHGSGFYYPCAWSLLTQFLRDPGAPLANACLSELPTPDFARAAGD